MKVNDFIQRLEHSGIKNAKQETLWLISSALGVSTSKILTLEKFSPDEIEKIDTLISRRETGEPLQYIMGEADFYGRDFYVGEGVLIPRHDTETLITAMKKFFPVEAKINFLDWGTGSGCIAITILLEYKNSFAYMLENSQAALKFAEKNLQRYNVYNRAKKISEINNEKDFDLIISNPPYIPSNEISTLEKTVKNFEPHSALDGGNDGMDFYKLILKQAMKILKPEGYIIFETGNLFQVEAIKNFNDEFVFEEEFLDEGNFPRCIVLRRRD